MTPLPSDGGQAGNWLAILDRDPAVAEQKYWKLYRDLARFFEWTHDDPESAAQEAIVRAALRMAARPDAAAANLRGFVFGVAKNLLSENWRRRRRERPLEPEAAERRPSPSSESARVEARLMLEAALAALTPAERRLLIRYVTDSDHAKQAKDLGMTPGALRVAVYRIREKLRAGQAAGRRAHGT